MADRRKLTVLAELTPAASEALLHAAGLNKCRATTPTRDYYVTVADDPVMAELVAAGLVTNCGTRSWLDGLYVFRLTEEGTARSVATGSGFVRVAG